MKQLFFIIVIIVTQQIKPQICSPEEIILIDNRVSFIDSSINNDSTNLRVYVKTTDNDKFLEITDFNNWPDDISETYNIFFDKNEKPIFFSLSPYSESGDWDLAHSFYFDTNGNTIFYRYSFSFFNSICENILRKFVDIYFNKNYKPIREREYYKDEAFNYIIDISECQNPYMFDLNYTGFKSFNIIIKKLNITIK